MGGDKIVVLDKEVNLISKNEQNYICLTDIAGFKEAQKSDDVIRNWIRNRNTLEFLGIWEEIHNPDFNAVEFDGFKKIAGLNSFTLTPKQWIERTNAKGIVSRPGRYGGTYAHKDIAFEFASWISPKFKLYLIKEFERLKEKEIASQDLDWSLRRNLAKINYKIHTKAIKENLIPQEISDEHKNKLYVNEADVLNLALFGMTSKMWKEKNKNLEGSLRDYATASQLVCLSNLESLNSVLIGEGIGQKERLTKLNKIAISQMKTLLETPEIKDKLLGEK